MHKPNSLKWRIIVGVFLAAVVMVVTILYTKNNSVVYAASEITIDAIPESLRSEVQQDIQQGGAYFYREGENAETSYVALSFGTQLDMAMNVTVTDIEGGLYFSITPVETESEEQVVYKLYETDAPSINTDKNVLRNPRLAKGSVGINVGFLQPTESGYYIEPLESDSENNRLYTAKEDLKIEAGLYRYSFQLTQDGAELLSASALDQYSKNGYITAIDTDIQTVQVVLVGDEKISYEMCFSASDTELVNTLQSLSEVGEDGLASFIFHYDANIKSLEIDKCEILNANTRIVLD